jgi:hypothetical protein
MSRASFLPHSLTQFHMGQRQVEGMISDRRPFDEIEDHIESMSVSNDEKSALWLLAWSRQPEQVRDQILVEALALSAERV